MRQRLLSLLLSRTWLLLLLLLGALSSAWYGLSNTISGMQKAPWVVVLIFGLLVGWLLARSRLKTFWALLCLFTLGIIYTLIFFAKLGSPLFTMLRTSLLYSQRFVAMVLHAP